MLEAKNVSVTLGGKPILRDVSFQVREGEWLMLVGPNGAGKSTLLGAVSRAVPFTGQVAVCGKDLRRMRGEEMARRMGVMSQQHGSTYAFTVEEVVRMGRYAHQRGLLGRGDPAGERRVEQALDAVGLQEKRHQSILTLSGGERQRTFLAQVLCQQPDVLLLDEPANHLDLVHQKQIFELVDEWRRQPGRAVVSVVHDLSLARRWGTHALLLNEGRCEGFGPLREVLTRENMARVWQMDVTGWMMEILKGWQEV